MSSRALTGDLLRPSRGQLAAGLAIGAFIVAYPFVVERSITSFGVQPIAAVLLLTGFVSRMASRGGSRRYLPAGPWLATGLVLVLLAALVSDALTWLLLLPALAQLAVADVFRASLRDGSSAIEDIAKILEPHVPEFIRPYCRKVTVACCCLFVVNAIVISIFAFSGDLDSWRLYSRWGGYVALSALFAVEFVIRKIWFRHYRDGFVDQLFAAVFPAERTERGRQSQEHIRRVREEIIKTQVEGT